LRRLTLLHALPYNFCTRFRTAEEIMKVSLTDKFCLSAKPGSWFDDKATGLELLVGKKRKTWQLHSTRDGKRSRETLGHYPEMTLSAARRRAVEGPTKARTLKAICEEFLSRSELRSKALRESAFSRLVYPELGHRAVAEIKRSEIAALLDDITFKSGPVMADQTLAYLRKVFNWHAARTDDFHSPIVMGMARTKPRERDRDRVLSDEELRRIWHACATDHAFHRFVRFLLLTALRRNEASEAHQRELENGTLVIPAERMKGKEEFVCPFSDSAVALIGNKGYWFSTDGGITPISGFSKFKANLDRTSGVSDWTLHDLRRTARSLMPRAGVSEDHAERCMAHKITGVAGVYNRYAYLEEKREALAKLAALVGEIVK
jgi:hypothetical protein